MGGGLSVSALQRMRPLGAAWLNRAELGRGRGWQRLEEGSSLLWGRSKYASTWGVVKAPTRICPVFPPEITSLSVSFTGLCAVCLPVLPWLRAGLMNGAQFRVGGRSAAGARA